MSRPSLPKTDRPVLDVLVEWAFSTLDRARPLGWIALLQALQLPFTISRLVIAQVLVGCLYACLEIGAWGASSSLERPAQADLWLLINREPRGATLDSIKLQIFSIWLLGELLVSAGFVGGIRVGLGVRTRLEPPLTAPVAPVSSGTVLTSADDIPDEPGQHVSPMLATLNQVDPSVVSAEQRPLPSIG